MSDGAESGLRPKPETCRGGTMELAAPLIAGNVAQMLMGVADTVMAGRLGVTPLAACAFASNLLVLPLLFGVGVLSAVTVAVARHAGAGDRAAAGEALRAGVWLAAGTGLVMCAGCLAGLAFLDRMGQPPEVAAEARMYFLLCGLSLPLAFVSLAGKNFAEALFRPWRVFLVTLGSVGLNVILNWALIFGTPLTPAMGLAGAGLATLLARGAGAAGVFWVLRADEVCRLWMPAGWRAPRRGDADQVWKLGAPSGLHLVAETGAFTLAGLMTGWLGAEALAAHQIALTCASLTVMAPAGIAGALSVRMGSLHGAGRRDELARAAAGALLLSAGFMSCAAVVFVAGGAGIARWFTPDAGVADLAARLLVVAGVFQVFDGLQGTAAGGLRGLHDVRYPAAATVVCYWLVALPAGWLLAFPGKAGALGVWWGLCLALALMAAVLMARLAAQLRRAAA